MWNLRKTSSKPKLELKGPTKMVKVQSQPNLWVEAPINANDDEVKRDYLDKLGRRPPLSNGPHIKIKK
jgi:hypothetical protein